jgi:hypothetical protein
MKVVVVGKEPGSNSSSSSSSIDYSVGLVI